MVENNNTKQTRGVTLREPKDLRRVVQRIVSRAFRENRELELSGRIAQLLGSWLRAWEVEKIAEIERRIEALERIVDERD